MRLIPSPIARSFALAGLALMAAVGLMHTGCEGTSSGTDNPGITEITVTFRDPDGAALRVTGTLDVYGQDQNPAVNPNPLATVVLTNSSLTKLSEEDFKRINAAGKTAAATKRSAAGGTTVDSGAASDTGVPFNLVFRGASKTGSLAFGFRYTPRKQASEDAFADTGGAVSRINLQPKPLVRFQATVTREPVHGELGRLYIPGTPFQATLAESTFVFEDLPEGVFKLRLLTGDGTIFPVKESLDTRSTKVFTAEPTAVGKLDTTKPLNQLKVEAGPPRETFVNTLAFLGAKLSGVDTLDQRKSILWRQIQANLQDTVFIVAPTQLRSEIKFRREGVYNFEIAVTVGAQTAKDTLVMLVREPLPPLRARMVQPRPGDTVFIGKTTNVAWEMPIADSVNIQFSGTSGKEWTDIARHHMAPQGLAGFAWTPGDSLAPSATCLIRVSQEVGDSIITRMEGTFTLGSHR